MLTYGPQRGQVAGGVARVLIGGALVAAAGCGLVLDNDPRDEQPLRRDGGDRGDGGEPAMDGSTGDRDGSTADATPGRDAEPPHDGSTAVDARPADARTADARVADASVPCPDGCDDQNACTSDFCTNDGVCAHETKTCATNASCSPETGECACDLGFVRCGDFCVADTKYECAAGTTDEVFCGGCGVRTCSGECQWGDCVAFSDSVCGHEEAVRCNSEGFCEVCVGCNWSTASSVTCNLDSNCQGVIL